jgi:predicted unusual protein kinase regulating ubiquinone biosynthesis (AarF/ABC1/UbiB family)
MKSSKSVHRTYEQPQKNNVINTVKFLISYQVKNIVKTPPGELALWTKDKLIELGPTFIKIGQFVSTRSDIFDKEVIKELKSLQDKAPPFPAKIAKEIISKELGRDYKEVFEEFIDEPLASASISQVHRATLKSNKKEVVIKVQRPYIEDYFARDFTTLNYIFAVAGTFNDRSINDSKVLLDDCYKYLYEELSFENEIENIKIFNTLLQSNTEIIVPKAIPKYSTSKIITMEYIPSKKIGSTKGVNTDLLSSMLMECFMKQILDNGIIHSDPHPGNIGLTPDGKIVLYDFGQVTKLDEVFTKSMKTLLFSVYERDVDAVTEILLKSKAIILTRPMEKTTIKNLIEQVIKYFETVDFKEFQLSMIESDLGMDLPFRINPKLIMVFRSLSLLEGICKDLDPTFSYFKVIDMLMKDVFLDMDYIDHRARKDLFALFDTNTSNTQMETIQNTIDQNNKKYMKNMNSTLKEYQKILVLLVLFNVWDFENLPKSIGIIGAFIYLILKVK